MPVSCQSCSSAAAMGQTHRQTDIRQLHRPCSAHYANNSSNKNDTRNKDNRCLLSVPRTWTIYGDRSFAVRGPVAWNSLPVALRSSDVMEETFRRHLKTFLFNYTRLHYTRLTALCPGLPGWAGTRKVKPIWILLEQETVSGSGISWAICKPAPRPRQTTTPTPHHSFFTGRMSFLPPNQQRQSTERSSSRLIFSRLCA